MAGPRKRIDVMLAAAAGVCVIAFAAVQGLRALGGSPSPDGPGVDSDHAGEREVLTVEEARQRSRRSRHRDGYEAYTGSGRGDVPRLGRGAQSLALRPEGPSGHPGDPLTLGPEASKSEFQGVLSELDDLISSEARLSRGDKQELYNRATGSYTALLSYVDGEDPVQRKFLDEAHASLLTKMNELGLKRPRERYRPKRRR